MDRTVLHTSGATEEWRPANSRSFGEWVAVSAGVGSKVEENLLYCVPV